MKKKEMKISWTNLKYAESHYISEEERFSKEQKDELYYYLKTEEYSNTKLPIEVDGEVCF